MFPFFAAKRLGWVNESRLASFIATTNVYQVLIDSTGSRRFLCVEVLKPISEEPLEHKQIYAQLKEELKSGAPDYLNKEEEKALQKHNQGILSPILTRRCVSLLFPSSFGNGKRYLADNS